jgi:hypothetical protein
MAALRAPDVVIIDAGGDHGILLSGPTHLERASP